MSGFCVAALSQHKGAQRNHGASTEQLWMERGQKGKERNFGRNSSAWAARPKAVSTDITILENVRAGIPSSPPGSFDSIYIEMEEFVSLINKTLGQKSISMREPRT